MALGSRCDAHDHRLCRSSLSCGLSFYEDSAGKVDGCDLYCNSTVNVAIDANGNPVIVGTAMRESDAIGVAIMGNGAGWLENCRIVETRVMAC